MARDYYAGRRARQPTILEMYPLGVSMEELAVGLKTSPSTIRLHIGVLERKKLFTKQPFKQRNDRFPHVFRLYAQLKRVTFPKDPDLLDQRIRVLEIALEMDRIRGYLQGLDETFMRLSVPECPPESLPRLRLLRAAFATEERARYRLAPPATRAEGIWEQILDRAAVGNRVPVSSEDLYARLLADFVREGRARIMPVWNETFDGAADTDAAIAKLTPVEQDIVRRAFGIDIAEQTPDEIAVERAVSRTRIYQILDDGLNAIRDAHREGLLAQFVTPIGTAYPEWRRSASTLRANAIHEARKALEAPEVELPLSPAMLELYLTSVDTLHVGVRASNCFEQMRIAIIGDLVQLTAERLREEKNFGRFTLKDVEESLEVVGLKLGTVLNGVQRVQFEDAKRRKTT